MFKRKKGLKGSSKDETESQLDKDLNFSLTTESEADFGAHMSSLMAEEPVRMDMVPKQGF